MLRGSETADGAVLNRIEPRFRRYELLRHAGTLLLGAGLAGMQELLGDRRGEWGPAGRAKGDPDPVRDDVLGYVTGAPVARVIDGRGDVIRGQGTRAAKHSIESPPAWSRWRGRHRARAGNCYHWWGEPQHPRSRDHALTVVVVAGCATSAHRRKRKPTHEAGHAGVQRVK